MVRYWLLVIFIGLGFESALACSPARSAPSDFLSQSGIVVVKGYFLPHDSSNLAKFKVIQSSDSKYTSQKVYPVYQYGPFGNQCESFSTGVSPPKDQHTGENNIRYLLLINTDANNDRLVTPIFYGHGLFVDSQKSIVSNHNEYTSLSDFESYIFGGGKTLPVWENH